MIKKEELKCPVCLSEKIILKSERKMISIEFKYQTETLNYECKKCDVLFEIGVTKNGGIK